MTSNSIMKMHLSAEPLLRTELLSGNDCMSAYFGQITLNC